VALRLPHVLALMALLLAAGVLSVGTLPEGIGVQGTLAISAPGLTLELAQQLQRERADLHWALLPAGDGALAPFDEELVHELVERGTAVALFVQPPQPELPPESWRQTWRVLIAPEEGDVLASLEAFLRAQSGTRPFLAGLILPADAPLPELVERLTSAADGLPAFRRTSLVLLGERPSGRAGRVVLRLDRGGASHAAPATLTDLLEARPDR
jgi:hypothetical protein